MELLQLHSVTSFVCALIPMGILNERMQLSFRNHLKLPRSGNVFKEATYPHEV